MHRSTFLKLAASTTFAAGARLAFPWAAAAAGTPVSFGGALWRAGGAGKVEKSTDGGRTWALHTDLGDMYAINRVFVRNYHLRLSVGYAGTTFPLVLRRDKRTWRTV